MSSSPNDPSSVSRPKREMLLLIDRLCDEFECAWEKNEPISIDSFVESVDASVRPLLIRELVHLEIQFRRGRGETIAESDYFERFPEFQSLYSTINRGVPNTVQEGDERERTLPANKTLMEEASDDFDVNDDPDRFGEYTLVSEIARGGMGVVFLANQEKANRFVALKMILSGVYAGREAIQRFQREAQAAAKLDHPSIVPIFDVGEIDGQNYFTMGYIDGESLRGRLQEGPLAPREAAQLLLNIADAIAYAHDQGVIHRDLKPSNILLDKAGRPKVTDFGLAKQVQSQDDLTVTGQMMGTPGYMPPEQAAGVPGMVDGRSDIYSLGAVLYCMLTGRPPFQAATVFETVQQVLDTAPVEPRVLNPNIDRDLETLCLRCLEKDQSKRYQNARELKDELQRYLDGKPIKARPISRAARMWRLCKRRPVESSLIAVVLLSLVLATGISTYFALLAQERARQAEQGTLVAVQSLETMINRVQIQLKLVPGTEDLRRDLLYEALASLQRISSDLRAQSKVDHTTATALLDLAVLQLQVGDENGLNAIANAKADVEKSHEILATLRKKTKYDMAIEREFADAKVLIAEIHMEAGELDQAQKLLEEADQVSKVLAERFHDEFSSRSCRASALTSLADCHALKGNYRQTIRLAESAIPHAKFAMEHGPPHRIHTQALLRIYEKLGDAYHDLGEHDQAYEYFVLCEELNSKLLAEEPTADVHDSQSFVHERLGNHWFQLGDFDQALEQYQKMKQQIEIAIELDPLNRDLREGIAVSNDKLAKTLRRLGQVQQANELTAEAQRIRAELSK